VPAQHNHDNSSEGQQQSGYTPRGEMLVLSNSSEDCGKHRGRSKDQRGVAGLRVSHTGYEKRLVASVPKQAQAKEPPSISRRELEIVARDDGNDQHHN
jgi:hypothetical protein